MGTEEKRIQHIKLTPREKDIINAIKEGYITDEDMANFLKIAKTTVRVHLYSIFEKLELEYEQQRAKLVWEVMR